MLTDKQLVEREQGPLYPEHELENLPVHGAMFVPDYDVDGPFDAVLDLYRFAGLEGVLAQPPVGVGDLDAAPLVEVGVGVHDYVLEVGGEPDLVAPRTPVGELKVFKLCQGKRFRFFYGIQLFIFICTSTFLILVYKNLTF